ncbi:MAG: hypothetical protein NDJ92_10425 [Thermoanaerobaculia bacterium]|nr:hypothetical protein [Thermoanaerobaculia bacterium]
MDDRTGRSGVRVTPLSSTGESLIPEGVPLPESDSFGRTEVVWVGSHYVVFWLANYSVQGIRVSAAGEVLDNAPTSFGEADWIGGVAFNGSRILLIRNRYQGHLADLLSSDLQSIKSGIELGQGHAVDVASAGAEFLVAIGSLRETKEFLSVKRISDSGEVMASEPNPVLEVLSGGGIELASSGDGYLALTSSIIRSAVFLARDGTLIRAVTLEAGYGAVSHAIWTGSEYAIVLDTGGTTTTLHRYSRDGELLAAPLVLDVTPPLSIEAIAARGASLLLIQQRNSDLEVRMSDAGSVLRPLTVSGPTQIPLAVAAGGGVDLAVWRDGNPGKLLAGRRTWSGELLDGAGRTLLEASYVDVRAAWTGTLFVVVWREEGNTLRAVRLSATDGVLDETPIDLASDVYDWAISGGGDNLLVAYVEQSGGGKRMLGVMLSATGVVGTTTLATLADPLEVAGSPSIAYDGAEFAVVWERNSILDPQPGCPIGVCPLLYDTTIVMTRVGRDGVAKDPEPVVIAAKAPFDTYTGGPRVASTGHRWVVVWSRGAELFARRVGRDGQLPDGSPFDLPPALLPAGFPYELIYDGRALSMVRDGIIVSALEERPTGIVASGLHSTIDGIWSFVPPVASRGDGTWLLGYGRNDQANGGIRSMFVSLMTSVETRRGRGARR